MGGILSDPSAFTIWPKIEGVDALAELALNLHWSWNHATDELWEEPRSRTLESHAKPWVILRTVSKDKIRSLLAQPQFRQRVDELLQQNRESFSADAWFQKQHPKAALTSVAYFSMEFMLSEALPIYSGGLGNVAGDQMKAASDLGVPITGIGLLWGQGYFRQDFDSEGRQRAFIRSMILASCPSGRSAARTVSGCASRFNCPDRRSGCVAGKCLLEGRSSICSMPTISPIHPPTAGLPASSMAATQRCG